jgi:hypothetical protein
MARPQKQVVDYFPHYCQHKKTLFILEERYGNNGYAFWFKLLEMLGNSKGHCLDLNDSSEMEFLMAKTHLSEVIGMEILDMLAKLNAIDPEAWALKRVWCQNFVDGVAPVYQSRRQPVPSKPSCLAEKPAPTEVISGRNPPADAVPHADNPQTRVDKTREEKTIGEEGGMGGTAPDGAPTTKDSGEDDALPEMTPLEDELRQLPSWGEFTMDDRVWLEKFNSDYPDTIPRDVRDMATYWQGKAKKHTKGQWKTRLRSWARIKTERGGGNGHTSRGLPGNQPGGAFSRYQAQFEESERAVP